MTDYGTFIERDIVTVEIMLSGGSETHYFSVDDMPRSNMTYECFEFYTLSAYISDNLFVITFLKKDNDLDIDDFIYVWPMREIKSFKITR